MAYDIISALLVVFSSLTACHHTDFTMISALLPTHLIFIALMPAGIRSFNL